MHKNRALQSYLPAVQKGSKKGNAYISRLPQNHPGQCPGNGWLSYIKDQRNETPCLAFGMVRVTCRSGMFLKRVEIPCKGLSLWKEFDGRWAYFLVSLIS